MDILNGLFYGFSVAASWGNLFAALMGAIMGTAVGVLPGLGPVGGAALILPMTFMLDPTAGLIMMAGIYYGSMYGGSTTSILLNIPGEAPSIVTAIDGYKMTLKGRAGAALTLTAVASFVGGTLAIVGVMLFSPWLSSLALAFGPGEYFALTAGGIMLLARITGGSFASGFLPMALGLMLSTVGMEAVTGYDRFTFGIRELSLGISLVPVVIGAYGIAELLGMAENYATRQRAPSVPLRELLPNKAEWRRSVAPSGRGTLIGFFFGLLPGPSATLSAFASYRLEKGVSAYRHEMGDGAVEGIVGPEAANNAAATSSLVPLLALGLPFSAVGALMIASMMVQGIQPGPLLIMQHPEIFWGVIASCYIGNVILMVLNIPMVGVWVKLLQTPSHVLIAMIVIISSIGAFSINNATFDIYVLTGMGILGFFLKKLGFQLAPMVVALMLGPVIEKNFREALFMSRGNLNVFWESGISVAIWAVVLIVLVGMPILFSRKARRASLGDSVDA